MGADQPLSSLPQRAPKWWQPYQNEFPAWRVWRGDNKLFYARLPGSDPLVIVHGENPESLLDGIIHTQDGLNAGTKLTQP